MATDRHEAEPGRLVFPDSFTWGVATAAHQIEGGNVNNDWWAWEHNPASGTLEPSGDACDSFNRWREDLQLVADMGLGAYRFSLEWSRIEPREGVWDTAAIDRYRAILQCMRGYNLEPMVTLHHFTTPVWLPDRGGSDRGTRTGPLAAFVLPAPR